jgi:hypothetical protein
VIRITRSVPIDPPLGYAFMWCRNCGKVETIEIKPGQTQMCVHKANGKIMDMSATAMVEVDVAVRR